MPFAAGRRACRAARPDAPPSPSPRRSARGSPCRPGRLGQRPVVGRPVVADGAAADEHGRRCVAGADCAARGCASPGCGCREALLRLRRPPLRRHRFARQVDDRIGALERRGPRSARAVGVPPHARDARHACARIVPRLAGREPARQHADVVALLGVHLSQRAAEKPRAARNHDRHEHPTCRIPAGICRLWKKCAPRVHQTTTIAGRPACGGMFDEPEATGVCTIMEGFPRFILLPSG